MNYESSGRAVGGQLPLCSPLLPRDCGDPVCCVRAEGRGEENSSFKVNAARHPSLAN